LDTSQGGTSDVTLVSGSVKSDGGITAEAKKKLKSSDS